MLVTAPAVACQTKQERAACLDGCKTSYSDETKARLEKEGGLKHIKNKDGSTTTTLPFYKDLFEKQGKCTNGCTITRLCS